MKSIEELARQVESKKNGLKESIDDFASSLRMIYISALTDLEKQNLALVASEADYSREIKLLTTSNSELLQSLTIETEDHKKTIMSLQHRTAEMDGYIKELEYMRKKNLDLMDMIENLTQEIGYKNTTIDTLKAKLTKLEQENEVLVSKAQRFKEYVGKSTSAYSQIANDDFNRRKLPPPIEPQDPSITIT